MPLQAALRTRPGRWQRNALPLPAGQDFDLELGARHANAEVGEHSRCYRMHLPLAHDRRAEDALNGFEAEQRVPRNVNRVAERKVLIDHLGPLTASVRGRVCGFID